ncbi:hypothetical protein [Glycomyces sp. NPDC048151]|uniref:hypothetical protein n=1 Tax=Glycomyces sp. NPDC048151 TaxID=3364002 RepID=UPI00371BB6FF
MNPKREAPMSRFALVYLLGAALVAVGVSVLIASTDFDPNPFMENLTNETGQLSGVVVASAGAVVVAIAAAAHSVRKAFDKD